MKKLLIVLFVVCLSLVFVCCDSEQLQKFGNTLGGTSGNLINPSGNTEAVSSVASIIASNSETIDTTVDTGTLTSDIVASASTEAGKAALKKELAKETEIALTTADTTAAGQWEGIVNSAIDIINKSTSSSAEAVTVTTISELGSKIEGYIDDIGENEVLTQEEISQLKGIVTESVQKVTEAFDTDSSSVCTYGTVASVLVFQSIKESIADMSTAVTESGGVGNMTITQLEGYVSPILNAFNAIDVINDSNFGGAISMIVSRYDK